MAKTDYTTSLNALLQRAVDEVTADIAKSGLSALKSVLDGAGFGEFEHLKTYEVFAHISNGEIIFEIQVEFEALDEDSQSNLKPRGEPDKRIRDAARTYALSGVGGSTRRVVGSRDARRSMRGHSGKQVHDARRPAKSATDARKGAEARLAEHEFAMRAPRGISITDQGRLSITLSKTIHRTERGVRFPQGDFDGIVKEFMEKLKKIVVRNFVPQLELIMSRNLK